MTDGGGIATYTYDSRNRLTQVSRGSDTFTYAYDDAGRMTRRTLPDGTPIDYSWDPVGNLVAMTVDGQTTNFEYDAAGRLVRKSLPGTNGYAESRVYDSAGRLESVVHEKGGSTLSSTTYSYDAAGRLTTASTPSETAAYAYDERGRLQDACFNPSCTDFVRYQYDAAGNIVQESRPGKTVTFAYDADGRLLNKTSPPTKGTKPVVTAYTHDVNGNLTGDGSKVFAYDLAGRLTQAKVGRKTTTYTYDGAGNRLESSSGSGASSKTRYVWDVNAVLPLLTVERDGNNSEIRRYNYDLAAQSFRYGGSTYYLHTDGLGSVTDVTSSTGTPEWSYAYEPFGGLRRELNRSGSAPPNVMRFTGQYFDQSASLYNLRARDYDPSLARFMQPDPQRPASAVPPAPGYGYANNAPTMFTDPSGLCSGFVDCVDTVLGPVVDPLVELGQALWDGIAATASYVWDHREFLLQLGEAASCMVAGAALISGAGTAAGAATASWACKGFIAAQFADVTVTHLVGDGDMTELGIDLAWIVGGAVASEIGTKIAKSGLPWILQNWYFSKKDEAAKLIAAFIEGSGLLVEYELTNLNDLEGPANPVVAADIPNKNG